MPIPKVDLLLCFPDIITSQFVVETLIPLVMDRAVVKVLCKTGMRSEYARSILLEEFMRGDSDYVFIVDTDMKLPEKVLPRLLRHKKRMTTGLYFGRGERCHPIIFLPEPLEQWPKTRYWDYPQNALIEVGACGHGCLLIHRSVIEAMEPPYSQLGPFGNQPLVGSDLRLCLKAREEAGVKIWCDTTVKCGHLRPQAVTEEDYLKDKEDYIREWMEYREREYGEKPTMKGR